MNTTRYLSWVCRALVGLMLVLAITVAMLLSGALRPWVWSERVTISGVSLHLPVMPVARFVTTSLGGQLLDGRKVNSRFGTVQARWSKTLHQLEIECAPCRLPVAALSRDVIELPAVRLTVQRDGDLLQGDVLTGGLWFAWQAEPAGHGAMLTGELAEVPTSELFALFQSRIPELSVARIEGSVAMSLSWELPNGLPVVEPLLQLDHVEGLGTERFRTEVPVQRCGRGELEQIPAKKTLAVSASRNRLQDGERLLRAAVIAAEDQRFYKHDGFDPSAMAAWFAKNTSQHSITGGASTISQQLARLVFVGGERSHIRKLRELLYAVEMEQTLGKARVLELYLAIVPWGPGVCGAEAAAKYYFGKRVAELTVVEAAWMAGLLRNPFWVEPLNSGQAKRTQWVVEQMISVPRKRREAALRELNQFASRSF